ncbi:MAG: MBL fold metallo-hydrolase [Dehalococcoidales bacterium]|nr:MBL fold metallo-hydrolase [Dehalococcoidales bacterium]
MKIKYLAHAAFLITSDNGTKIVTDPYETSPGISYAPISETADVVTVSHEHGDHNNAAAVQGSPTVIRDSAEVKGISFKAVAVSHDESGGSQRGKNTIFCFNVDGVNICHCGDLGHELNTAQISAIGIVDVLMIPVGGFFTIDAKVAAQTCNELKSKIILPMHYKTGKSGLPIAGVDDFLKGKDNVTRSNDNEIKLTAATLPARAQIIVLKPALLTTS